MTIIHTAICRSLDPYAHLLGDAGLCNCDGKAADVGSPENLLRVIATLRVALCHARDEIHNPGAYLHRSQGGDIMTPIDIAIAAATEVL